MNPFDILPLLFILTVDFLHNSFNTNCVVINFLLNYFVLQYLRKIRTAPKIEEQINPTYILNIVTHINVEPHQHMAMTRETSDTQKT